MDIYWQVRIIFLLILLLLSSFFSGSEAALFSLDKKRLKPESQSFGTLAEKNNLRINSLVHRYILNLLEHPRRLLVSILIGNTVVNVGAAIVAVSLAIDILKVTSLSQELILTLQILVLTILIIIFGELTPKIWAAKNPLAFAKHVSIPLYWFCVIIYPVSETITELIRTAAVKIKFIRKSAGELGHETRTLAEEEQEIIQSIVSFKSVPVQEVMTPRVDIISVSAAITLPELIELIKTSQHSRIPLYKKNLDEIVGIIYAKDILKYLLNKDLNDFDIMKIYREAMFIPKTKMINDLMSEFQEKKMHIAIVVDEFGGTAGLITLEDIIEEIVGEIRDEYDKEEETVVKLDENKYMVFGRISLDELNELLNTNISVENGGFETLAGLVLNQAGYIPKEDYNFNLENFKFTVKEVTRKRINKVLIEKISGE